MEYCYEKKMTLCCPFRYFGLSLSSNRLKWANSCFVNRHTSMKCWFQKPMVVFIRENAPHIGQTLFATHWTHSAGEFYPMRLTRQTWLLLITTCLYGWATHLLHNALVHTKIKNNFRWIFTAKGEDVYWRGILKLPEIWRKCTTSDGPFFEPNTFYRSAEVNVSFFVF